MDMDVPYDVKFQSLTDEKLQGFVAEKDSKSTKSIIRGAVKVFEEYCTAQRVIMDDNVENLASILGKFYIEVRQTNGEMYTKTSMISIRYGLQRHFQNTHDIDIVKDKSEITLCICKFS
ncbi:uncharacterized protein LOC111085855 [Limulus polyphemus]|uniref:Uncharacterized protein LOC111085855 n=1 Tax=Limulus polyphemus TaxID=6850 RepID=A0ABM1SEN4_LIMPO|nr:uncharacterized protein LOC111085855 [Limulus polyphemus]